MDMINQNTKGFSNSVIVISEGKKLQLTFIKVKNILIYKLKYIYFGENQGETSTITCNS